MDILRNKFNFSVFTQGKVECYMGFLKELVHTFVCVFVCVYNILPAGLLT